MHAVVIYGVDFNQSFPRRITNGYIICTYVTFSFSVVI